MNISMVKLRNKFMVMLIIGFLFYSSLGTQSVFAQTTTTKTIDTNFSNGTSTSFVINETIAPEFPSVGDYVTNNITNFDVPNASTYVGTDIVDGTGLSFYDITLTLEQIHVINDHDGIASGAGDIYIYMILNDVGGQFDNSGSTFSMNDGETQVVSFSIQNTYTTALRLYIEVIDDDLGVADSLGYYSLEVTPMNVTSTTVSTDIGDAEVTFSVDSLLVQTDITAEELLDGYKPYLHIDDETSNTEMPDYVAGRVVKGFDGSMAAYVLQYFYYWDSEFAPDGIGGFETHRNDFEAIYIYLSASNIYQPYRLVFNNFFYLDVATAEFPSEDILILSEGASPNTLTFNNEISSDLQSLLGVTTEQTADIRPLSDANDWTYAWPLSTDSRRISPYGFIGYDFTVETSFHTFDLGPGGTEYGYAYTINSLDDALLRDWYSIQEDTFINGTKIWSAIGIDVPIIAPFTFDVKQVFNAPYIISGYSNVVEAAGEMTKARNSRFSFYQEITVGMDYSFPGQLSITHPTQMRPGETSTIEIEFIPSNNLELTIWYEYQMNTSLTFWYAQTDYDYSNDGSITFDIDLAQIEAFLDFINFEGYSSGERTLIDNYLSVEGFTLNPTLLGDIFVGEIQLNLWTILNQLLSALFPPIAPILTIIGFFIDTMALSIMPTMSARVHSNINSADTGVTLNQTDLIFTEGSMKQTVSITIDEGVSADTVNSVIGDLVYSFDAYVDWYFKLSFKSPVSLIIPDIEYHLGTYPYYTAELSRSSGTSFDIGILLTQDSSSEGASFLGLNVMYFGISMCFMTVIYLRRRNQL